VPVDHGEQMAKTNPPEKDVVHEVTRLLEEAGQGRSHAAEALLPLVYEQLRKLAAHRMTGERSDHTLQATALVHEAYVRLVGNRSYPWANRAQFFVAAAEAMRRILIEHARAKNGPCRGGKLKKVPLDVIDLASTDNSDQIMALDEAISRLEKQDPDAAKVVQLRFFAGLGVEETAQALGMSPRTVKREWAYARAFLFRVLEET
jgi:RNA polymerase sigma factor (TIGR02999 family)